MSEVVPVWPAVRYISDIGQYRCTVSGLPLFFIFINIYIYIYVCVGGQGLSFCVGLKAQCTSKSTSEEEEMFRKTPW